MARTNLGRRRALGGLLAAPFVGGVGFVGHGAGAQGAGDVPAGLFVTEGRLRALRGRRETTAFVAHAAQSRDRIAEPFVGAAETLRFGWTEAPAPPDDTLREAVVRLRLDTHAARNLALAFALGGDPDLAVASERLLLAWARRGLVVNFYDYDPDFAKATLIGKTKGFGSDRPWNFGLDMIWQAYGLLNAGDALLLLRHGGHRLAPESEAAIAGWLRALAEGTNSGLHAWTRWAQENASEVDANGAPVFHDVRHIRGPHAVGIERHMTDNHLSWAMAGLLAAAAALGDRALAAHVLFGDEWTDRRAGRRRNPAPLPDVMRRAIEPDGRVFEERIERDPPIRYALFHIAAWCVAGRIAELRFDTNLWQVGSLLPAFRRYAPYRRGDIPSPSPKERPVEGPWMFAMTPPGYGGDSRRQLLEVAAPPDDLTLAIGPAALLFGA